MSLLKTPGPWPHRSRPGLPAVALLVAAGLLAASAASAAVYYVATTGSDTNAGTSAGAPWRTIAKASATLVAGDVVRVAAGTYSEELRPTASGTSANRITFVGDIANPAAVTVNAIQYYGQDYVSVKGFRATGNIGLSANTSGNSADRDSILHCIGLGGLSMNGTWYSVVANCTIGTGDSMDKFGVGAYPGDNLTPTASVTQWNTVQDCSFNVATIGGSNAMTHFYMRNNRFIRNRYQITILPGAVDSHGNTYYRCVNNQFIDCSYTLKNMAGYEAYLLNVRDSSRFNAWTRDTFTVDPTSTNTGKVLFGTSGSYPSSVRYNSWTDCFIKVTGTIGYQNPGYGDRITGNVFIYRGSYGPIGDSLVIRHNTYYNAVGPVVWDMQQVDLTRSTVVGNLFYGTGSAVNGHVIQSDVTSNRADSNLFFATGNDPARAVYGRGSAVASAVGSGTTWCNNFGRECNSLWANPQLMSATWNAPDVRPALGSPAYGAGFPDGYAGAYSSASLVGDATPPGPVGDLATSQVGSNGLVLTWTAPGDDGSSGTAAAYDIRWSTSPIDASNFALATPFAPLPDPVAAGQSQTYAALGLSPTTAYWFALKTRDEATNWSSISNVVTATTTALDTTPPATITDLGASP